MTSEPTQYNDTPADYITIACFTYMARIMEARDFWRFFYGIIRHADVLAKGLSEPSKSDFETEAAKYSRADGTSGHNQFIHGALLSRATESFDLYVLQILRLIYSVRSDLVVEEEKLASGFPKSDFKTADQYFLHLAERKLQQLGYMPLSELRIYFSEKVGLDLFDNDESYEIIMLATEVRNLLAHNDGCVSEIFIKRTRNLTAPSTVALGERYTITDVWLRIVEKLLDHTVFRFDDAAIKYFSLPTYKRSTSFLFRG